MDFKFDQRYIDEFSYLMSISTADPAEKLEYVAKATNSYIQGMVNRNALNGEKYALAGSYKQRQKLAKTFSEKLIASSGLEKADIAQAKGMFPSTVAAVGDQVSFEKEARKAERSFNIKANSPEGVASIILQNPAFTDMLNASIKNTPTSIEIDSKKLKQAFDYWSTSSKNIGSVGGKFASTQLMSHPVFSAMLDKWDIIPPDAKRRVIENINSASPQAASAFSESLLKKNVPLSDVYMYSSMAFNMPEQQKKIQDSLLFVTNPLLKKHGTIDKYIQEELAGGDADKAKSIKESLESSINDSAYIKDVQEIARASGIVNNTISYLFDKNNLKLAALHEYKDSPDTNPWYWFSNKESNAVDGVIKKYYNNLTPVNHTNLKAMVPGSENMIGDVSNKATVAVKTILNGIKRGDIQYDIESLLDKKAKSLTKEQIDKWYTRDAKNGALFDENNTAFVAKDLNGRIGSMSLMFKDKKSGEYRLLKIKDKNGKPYNPTIDSIDDLKNNSENIILKKLVR